MLTVIKELRYLARREHGKIKKVTNSEGKVTFSGDTLPLTFFSQRLKITTRNNFPTAAGLASSASGFSALTFSIAHLYGLTHNYQKHVKKLSEIARQGSGSACRSMLGGFVEWVKGEESNGEDSVAQGFEDLNHWPDLRFIICVVSGNKKKVPSTQAMIRSQKTSTLLEHRTDKVADQILGLVKKAIKDKNFDL